MYRVFFKRVIDIVVSFLVLAAIWPVLLCVVVWLHFVNKGAGVFFTQKRPGKDGKIFKVIKFKSMTDECNEVGVLFPDKKRLTRVGAFIRKTSIDELPQLINVLKGDMSLVGPRPLLISYLTYYTERENQRHLVRPGITGLAQISGRNNLGWDERLELDVGYVEDLAFGLDMKILYKTFMNVLRHKDVNVIPGNGVNTRLDQQREI